MRILSDVSPAGYVALKGANAGCIVPNNVVINQSCGGQGGRYRKYAREERFVLKTSRGRIQPAFFK